MLFRSPLPQVPSVDDSADASNGPSSSQTVRPEIRPLRFDLAAAQTLVQMPASEPSLGSAPTLMLPRFVSKDVSAEAKTLLRMPALTTAPPSLAAGAAVAEDLESAATIQMPAWDGTDLSATPSVPRPACDLPKASLFLPIFVVDDDGNEIPD